MLEVSPRRCGIWGDIQGDTVADRNSEGYYHRPAVVRFVEAKPDDEAPDILAGTFRFSGSVGSYDPAQQANLPNAVAKIEGRKEAARFLSGYGPLGFQQMKPTPETWPQNGEPLGWILAQARTVSFALDLIAALDGSDDEALKRTLRLRRRSGGDDAPRVTGGSLVSYRVCRDAAHHGSSFDPESLAAPLRRARNAPRPARARVKTLDAAHSEFLECGWYDPAASYLLRAGSSPQALRDHAAAIVVDLVNSNSDAAGAAPRFAWRDGRFCEHAAPGPLAGVVWLLVAAAAQGPYPIRHCAECGAPFVARHAAQKFCPVDYKGTQSRCAKRNQKRELRRRETL